MNGWIKIHRKIINWGWYSDIKTTRLFFHLLLTANHDANNWLGFEIKPGQCVCGLESLSKTTGISVQSLRTSLERLKSTNEITIKTTNKFSVITIVNWDKYQCQENNQQANQQAIQQTINKQTTNKQQHYKKLRNKETKKVNNILSDEPTKEISVFSFREKIESMATSKDRRMNIIAYYWVVKRFKFTTENQYSSSLKRELKASAALVDYPNEKIKEVCDWLQGNADFKWTLETVGKYINEDLNNLNNRQSKVVIV